MKSNLLKIQLSTDNKLDEKRKKRREIKVRPVEMERKKKPLHPPFGRWRGENLTLLI